MKKVLVLLILAFTCSMGFAQQIAKFRSTELAIKMDGEWSDWMKSSVNITMDFNNDKIIIYSDKTQIYRVLEQLEAPYDATGEQIAFKVIDQDCDYGRVRLRIENNGNSQIYVDFADISWVYNVRRIK